MTHEIIPLIPVPKLTDERMQELYKQLMNPKPQIPYNPDPEDSGNSGSKKYPKMDLTSLVKGGMVAVDQLEEKAQEEFAGLFGIEYNFFRRVFNFVNSYRYNSGFFTRDEIAQILLKNNLVSNIEHGLQEVDRLSYEARNGACPLGKTDLREYRNSKGEKKFRFEYHGKRGGAYG
ncbi:hypothetical protein HYX19_01765 [Candidatus Woesearchaeota archaeon]|nr:hypothetical protein [Candidatus Woesearchaeota archaeon]